VGHPAAFVGRVNAKDSDEAIKAAIEEYADRRASSPG
jgi:hypothetical protein